MKILPFGIVVLLLSVGMAQAQVVINEFLAVNKTGLTDENTEYSDWIELYNSGTGVVDLTGWTLTDDPGDLTQWPIPSVNLAPGQYRIAFASSKDRRDPSGEWHTNFKLSGGGDYLALVGPDGQTVEHAYTPEYPEQLDDISFGISSNVLEIVRYFSTPTPGAANTGEYQGLVEDTKFSVDRGFYTNAFQVAITTLTQNAVIQYTLDGSTPTPTHGSVYSGPLSVAGTTCLRAIAWKPGYRATDVDTHTYLFIDDVRQQSPNGEAPGPGWPTGSVKNQVIAYGMDPDVTSDARYTNLIDDALLALPSISLVTDLENFFDPTIGIYVNPSGDSKPWERPCSVELLNPDGSKGFQINAGIRIRGGFSRSTSNPKHALRLFFRSEYGDGKLRYLLFGDEGTDRFDGVDLRTSQNYSWSFQYGNANTMLRDVFSRDIQGACGQPYTRSRYYHLYLDGHYWGIYQTQERAEASYAESYYGDDADDYDVVKPDVDTGRTIEATDGNLDAYRVLYDMDQSGWVNETYFKAQGLNPDGSRNPNYTNYLDAANVADYMLITYFTGDRDGPGSRFVTPRPNNFFGIFSRANPDGFKFFEHDSEHSLNTGFIDMVNPLTTGGAQWQYFNQHWLHEQLATNSEYRVLFMDRAYQHFFNDGPMSASVATNILMRRAAQIDTAIIAESARWGDKLDEATPRTRDDHWIPAVTVARNWLNGRQATVLSQLRGHDWYPDHEPPVFNQHGGSFTSSFDVTMSASETIYYTLDGSDPRERITGNVAGTFYSGAAVNLTQTTLVKARARTAAGEWSALNQAIFALAAPPTLALTEVMYNPREPQGAETNISFSVDAFEFVALQNIGPDTVGLAGLQFTDGIIFDFTGAESQLLAPGERVLVVADRPAFAARYATGGLTIAGEYEGSLNNGGEDLTLTDPRGSNVFSITYNDARGWPMSADGAGHALVPTVTVGQSGGLLDYGGHWRASGLVDGSPGAPDPAPGLNVVINEIAAHTDTALPPPDDSDDWIELHNPLGVAADISGWMLSDDPERLDLYTIPTGTVIQAGGFLTLRESTDFHTNRLDGSGFGLNKAGEAVYLTRHTPSGLQVVDGLAFKGQENGVSLGRYPDGAAYVYELALTTNAPNAAPQSRVLISELMVAPLVPSNMPGRAASHEYVEIFNPLTTPVALSSVAGAWRLDGGVSYVFPTNTVLQPSEYAVVVGFDPLDNITLNDFLDSYGLTNGQVRIFGPYGGRLDNRTERVAIERPQEGDAVGEGVSWIIIDEAIYFVDSPWPSGTVGTGASLQRSISPDSGRDPGNWFAALEGTPGVPGTLLAIASPASGSRYFVPDTVDINVAVEAQRVSNSVVQVEILDGSNVLCVVTQAPYRCTLTVDAPRTYFLRAEMTDAAGVHTSRLAIVDGLLVEAHAATGVTDVAATCVGALVGSGDVNMALYWGDEDGGLDAIAWDQIASLQASGGAPLAVPLDRLTAGRTYYYRFRAEVEGRFAWSTNTVSFRATPLDEWAYTLNVGFPWAPASPLADFPVLVKLHDGISGFSYGQFSSSSGADLRFGDGVTGDALLYEIELWDTGGVSVVWVQVPQLSSNTSVNAHWGYAPAASAPPAYAVDGSMWSDDYDAVWHLDPPLKDATRQYADAPANGVPGTSGIVGDGLDFDGQDHPITNAPPQSWYGKHMDGLTVSMWVKPDAATVTGSTPWGVTGDQDGNGRLYIDMNRSPFVRRWRLGLNDAEHHLDLYQLGQWQYLAVVISNGYSWAVFNDDAPQFVTAGGPFTPVKPLTLGGRTGLGRPFNGQIDELRLSSKRHSAAWLRAEHDTVALHDTETVYGGVDTGTPDPDQDGDGIPDAWEQRFPQGIALDPDGNDDADLLSNYEEFIAGTDPTNSASTFQLDLIFSNVLPMLRFYARDADGVGYEGLSRYYTLESTLDLTSGLPWTGLPGQTNLAAAGQWVFYTNVLTGQQGRHYRARTWLNPTVLP